MARRWKCARCSTENDEGVLTCSNCRMIRGAVVVPGTFNAPVPGPVVAAGPASAPVPEPDRPAAADPPGTIASSDLAPAPWDPSGIQVAAPEARLPLWRRIPIGWVIVGVLVLGGGIAGFLANANRSASGEITKGGDLVAADLRVGDCFDLKDPNLEEIGDVTAVPCANEHEYEMYFVGTMADGAFPTEDAFNAFFESNCLGAFESYVGKAYEDSELDIFWLVPVEDSWGAGDRSVQCAVYHPRIHRLTGSMKGSAR